MAEPDLGIDFHVPPGRYQRLRLGLTVRHGGWLGWRPNARFNIFWLARNRNRDLVGYTAIENKNRLFVRHGIGQVQPEKARLQTRVNFEPGRTYRFEYLYDTAARHVELVVTSGGRRLARLTGRPNVSTLRIGRGQHLVIGFSFDGEHNPKEQPSLGWQYRDLVIEVQ